MKSFKQLMSEVAQPSAEDEINFKAKHIIDPKDHPAAPDHVFSGNVDKDDADGMKRYRKNKRLADYQPSEDSDVYEGVSLTRDIPGQEGADVDKDGDSDMTDAQFRHRRHAQIKKYKIDESWSDGISSRNAHTHASTAAKYRKKANDSAAIAKRHSEGSPEHNKHMGDYHSAMAKSIKSSYHAGNYGSVNTAKRDHNAEMAKAKEYKSSMSEEVELDEAVYVIPEAILATERDAFHSAAANAHKAGQTHFSFSGKKYPVTMSKDAASTFAGKGMNEKVKEPYAVGMAQAMKSTGDQPPLEKKTIRLAHKIAKGIEKNEALDPVGKEDDDIDNNRKITKHDKYLHNRRKAITQSIRAKMKEGFGTVTAAGGDYDEEESHQRYKKSNTAKKEDVSLSRDGKGTKIFAGKTKEAQIDEGHGVFLSGGSVGEKRSGKPVEVHKNIDDAKAQAKRLNKLLSPGEKQNYRLKYHVKPVEEGFVVEAIELDEAEVNEGPFKGLGKMMMKRKLKKDMSKHGDEMDSDLDKGWAGDDFVKAYDEKKRKQNALSRLNREEVELDEVSDEKLDRYRQKAFADQPAGDDGSDKYRKRKFGRDLAFAKQTGRAKVLATKESVELDELSKDTLTSYAIKAHRKGDMAARMSKSGADKDMANYANKRFQGVQTAIKKLGEEEQIDELSNKTLGSYIKKASHDVATNSAATGRYGERANKEADVRKKTGDMSNYQQGREDNKMADKFFKKSWKRREGIAKATDRLTKEDLDEAFKVGIAKLNDGSSVLVKEQDAKLLNKLVDGLKTENKSKMMNVAMKDKKGFNEILSFAREAI